MKVSKRIKKATEKFVMSVLKDASHLSDMQLNSISGTLVLLGEMEYAETVKTLC